MIGNTQQMVFCIVNKPKKILKEEALLVIETRKPLGLFYRLVRKAHSFRCGMDSNIAKMGFEMSLMLTLIRSIE